MTNNKAKFLTFLAVTILLTLSGFRLVYAQEEESEAPKAAAGATPQASGPIDIQADEQEFATDSVIAKGKVRVLYKDSIILAPLATLYKDETGNPNRAVFTGHPFLTQGHSKMDANTLTFEMQKQKIVAVGNAHSEVDIPDDEKDNGLTAPAKGKAAAAPPVAAAPKTSFDLDDDDDKPAVAADTGSSTAAKPAEQKDKPPEKIITDSERQEFDQATGKFDCFGHVKVINGEMLVYADKMQVIYGATSNKPETCLFTGNVTATQGKNTTCADNINYSLSTKRLQASGNVKSKVIQEKGDESKKGGPTASGDLMPSAKAANSKTAAPGKKELTASASATSIALPTDGNNDKPFWVFSDAQDYNRDGGRMAAQGNVKVVNGDMYGCGPSVVLTKKSDGKADKVYFIGRSQITQPGRRWIADEITYVVENKQVIANGNARAMVMQGPDAQKSKRKTVDVQPAPQTKDPGQLAIKKPDQVSQAPGANNGKMPGIPSGTRIAEPAGKRSN